MHTLMHIQIYRRVFNGTEAHREPVEANSIIHKTINTQQ